MASAYERCPSVGTDSGGGEWTSKGNPNGGAEECYPFLAGFLKKRKTHFSLLSTIDRGG